LAVGHGGTAMAESNGNIPGGPLAHRAGARDMMLIAGDSPVIHGWTETTEVGSGEGIDFDASPNPK
jgi:hypothetical protein